MCMSDAVRSRNMAVEKGTRKEAGCRRDEDVEVDVWGDEDGQDTK